MECKEGSGMSSRWCLVLARTQKEAYDWILDAMFNDWFEYVLPLSATEQDPTKYPEIYSLQGKAFNELERSEIVPNRFRYVQTAKSTVIDYGDEDSRLELLKLQQSGLIGTDRRCFVYEVDI